MALFTVQTTTPYVSGLPSDVITNTTHWDAPAGWSSAQTDDLVERLTAYYETIYGENGQGRQSLAGYVQAKIIIKVYEANPTVSPTPPVAVEEVLLSLDGSAPVAALPSEVAIVTSQYSALTPGAPLGRYYNRHYIGGLTQEAITVASSSTPAIVSGEYMERYTAAAKALHDENTIDLVWVLGRRVAGELVAVPMVGGFVGNEPDTQRRRGVRQSLRESWTA